MSLAVDFALCDYVEELGFQGFRRIVVADFHLRRKITELLKRCFHPVIAENLAYPESVLRQYCDDLLPWNDFDVFLNAGVFPARKMTL